MKRQSKLLVVLLSMAFVAGTALAQKTNQKPNADVLLKQAIAQTNVEKDYPKAISTAQKALAVSPNYPDVRLLLGRLYLLTGKYSQSRTQLIWVINKQPNNLDALNYLINLEITTKNNDKAIAYIDQALKYTNSQELVLKKASLLEAMHRYQAGYKTLEPVVDKSSAKEVTVDAYVNMRNEAGRVAMQKREWAIARREFLAVLAKDPSNEYAINQLYSIEVSTQHYKQALYYANMGLKQYPKSENFLFKKASLLGTMNRPFDAYPVAKQLTETYPNNEKGKRLAADFYSITRQNLVGLNYDLTFFDKSNVHPWNLGSAYYIRTEKKISYSGRVTYADRGFTGGNGLQFETEIYPKYNRAYSYIDAAYSNSIIFPKWRLGYSFFKEFDKGWEGELGLRYIDAAGNHLFSYGGSVGKYIGDYWINLSPYLTSANSNTYLSATLTTRRYFDTRDDYLTLILGAGDSPTDRTREFQFISDYGLSSYRATFGYQHLLKSNTIVGVLGTINNQEIAPSNRRNEFDIFLKAEKKF